MQSTEAEVDEQAQRAAPGKSWVPYAAPMVVFLLVTAFEPQSHAFYPYVYIAKVLLVSACLLAFRSPLGDIRFDLRAMLPAILVGAAVFAEWIWLRPLTHYPPLAFLGKRAEYNPFVSIDNDWLRMVFLAARFYGLALLVPVVEEIFWRSFLLRFFTDMDDFQRVRLSEFSWFAFGAVALAFGLAHPEWLEAVICACAYGLLLRQTRSLFACIVAHSVTNLMLGIYIVNQHAWSLW